jgi:hypothetical protein
MNRMTRFYEQEITVIDICEEDVEALVTCIVDESDEEDIDINL